MRTELVFPSQVEPNDRLLIDDQIISVVGAFPPGMVLSRGFPRRCRGRPSASARTGRQSLLCTSRVRTSKGPTTRVPGRADSSK